MRREATARWEREQAAIKIQVTLCHTTPQDNVTARGDHGVLKFIRTCPLLLFIKNILLLTDREFSIRQHVEEQEVGPRQHNAGRDEPQLPRFKQECVAREYENR